MATKIVAPSKFVRTLPIIIFIVGGVLLVFGIVDFFVDFMENFYFWLGVLCYLVGTYVHIQVSKKIVTISGRWV